MKTFILSAALFLFCIFLSVYSIGQGFEYGDAPENVTAYPSVGTVGMFPTCVNVGTGYVKHNNFGAQLGPTYDFEGDGNAGLCPGFAPYDNDECFADGDAGLLFPEPYTIVNGQVVTCPNSVGTTLGPTCSVTTWGGNVDITVSNFMPNETPGIMNVVFDFSQNGTWGDQVSCPAGMVPEHVLVDFGIPWGYSGPLSGLSPPAFTTGPNTGYVWARFTISEQQVGPDWDGQGDFEDGESEDYLIYIGDPPAQSDFGDAPDSALAYPSSGTLGLFPTCMGVGTGYIEHIHFGAELGPSVDYEIDGNAGLCPSFAPYDDDECFNGGDAGLLFPEPYTIIGGNVATCPNSNGTPLGYPCDTAVWGNNIDIDVHNNMPTGADGLMNVLIDWNKNGVWGDVVFCDTVAVPEHVLQNFAIPHGHTGTLSSLLPPDFIIGPEEGFFWARFTISDMAVNVPWDGSGFFEDGETEDYLLHVDTAGVVSEIEYGDAPDGVLGYPSNGVIGSFPSCVNVPASGFVSHMNFGAHIGPAFDYEIEGNAGLCPAFTPYDNDECFSDGDAGLLFPDPYTIQGGVVVTCPGSAGTGLGFTCMQANWGTEIDMNVTNNMPSQAVGYFNVLFDWNQNGVWGDVVSCPTAAAPEHVLQNLIVPNGYSGPVSALMPGAFMIGPNAGYAWARFTITDVALAINWDGSGSFEDGESEDYLIAINTETIDAEYGDAPEGSIGYPSTGVMGNFPTCIFSGPTNHYVSHMMGEGIFFGPLKDMETDGNAGICSPYIYPYDNDECFQDNDAGLILPAPYTIVNTGGAPSVVPCTGVGGMLDSTCHFVNWGAELDINVTNMDTIEALVNVLMDFNQNGRWDFDTTMHCNGVTIHEHVLVNFPVPSGYSGPLSALNPPSFMVGPNVGYIWTRFTVSEQAVVMDWDGVGFFDRGESEDYLLYIDLFEGLGENDMPKDINLQIFPNPTSSGCTISYILSANADVNISIFDIRGSLIRQFDQGRQSSGKHSIKWDGYKTTDEELPAGLYIVTVSLNSSVVERAKLLIE